MGFEWVVDSERELVTIVAAGRVDFESTTDLMRTLANDPRYRSSYPVLVDLRQLDYTASMEETHKFADLMAELGIFRNRMALVVSSSIHFGVGRQMSALAGRHGRQLEVFTGMRNALRWLGVADEPRT